MATLCCAALFSFFLPIADNLPQGAMARFGEHRFRTGSSNNVLSLSPDGKWIAMACPFDNIAILDAETGRRIQLLKPKTSQATEEHRFAAIAWSHGGTVLAGLDCQQKRVCVWDVPSGRYIQTFVHKEFPDKIYRSDLVITANCVVVRCENRPWVGKLTDGEFQPLEGEQPGTSYAYFDISPDEKYLAVVSHTSDMNAQRKDRRRNEIRVYELGNGTLRKTLKTKKETSAAIFAGGSNRILADHDYDGSGSWLYDLDTGELLQKSVERESLPALYRENHACVWVDSSTRRVERSYDGGKTRQRFRASGFPGFASVAFLKDGTLRFVRNNGSNLEVWDWANQPNAKPVPRHNPKDPDLQNTMLMAAFCNDGKGLRTLHQTGHPTLDVTEIVHLREFDLATRVCTRLVTSDFRTRDPLDLQSGTICRIDCSNADLSLLGLSAVKRNSLGTRTWKPLEGQLDSIFEYSTRFFTITDSGKQILIVHEYQKSLHIHDLDTDTRRSIQLNNGSSMFTDKPILVKTQGDFALVVWSEGPFRGILTNWKKCTQLDRFQVSLNDVTSIDLTPNGNFAIVASPVGFHLHHTRLHVLLARHERDDVRIATGPVLAPDGNSFAVALHHNGSSDAHVEIWDLFGTGPRASFAGHIGGVKRLVFSPDGNKLVSVGDDSTAIVWDVQHATPLKPPASLEQAWKALAGGDEPAAYTAERMLRTPEGVEFIRRHLKLDGSEVPAPEQVQKLIANLAHEQFSIRAAAEVELVLHARYLKNDLQAVLKTSDNLEQRDRLERILKSVDDARITPRLRQGYRAVRLLDELKTPEATKVLKLIASGHAEGWLTQAASEALRDSK